MTDKPKKKKNVKKKASKKPDMAPSKNDIKVITDDDSEVILHDERVLQPLLMVLESGTPEVRVMTIEAIVAIPTDEATKVLTEALEDPDENVREAAKQGLALRAEYGI